MENKNFDEQQNPDLERSENGSINIENESLESEDKLDQTDESSDENASSGKNKKGFFGKKKESELDIVKQQLVECNAKAAEIHDKYIRLYSEFDNFRKRTQKEKLDIIVHASEDLILTLLPVIDDLERALANFDDSEELMATKEGVTLIYQKMIRLLQQKGLKPIEAIDKIFDTDFHEAVTIIPLPEGVEPNSVIDEIEKGYMLNDKVIRYSKVVIAK
ncbi:MAG: nucleotide exchange factor GrpE [Bacteroidales bacterium]|nr:nucleotide exchange factor GrpE [Bacteroidales bacterium]MDY0215823.1 nucleotide exchange factor GrpE [Bacteroidales bacterium]